MWVSWLRTQAACAGHARHADSFEQMHTQARKSQPHPHASDVHEGKHVPNLGAVSVDCRSHILLALVARGHPEAASARTQHN